MKKITLLLLLFISTIASAQTVAITQINGTPVADFLAATTPARTIVKGQAYTLTITYTGLAVGNTIAVRPLTAGYGAVTGSVNASFVTTATDGTQTVSFNPNVYVSGGLIQTYRSIPSPAQGILSYINNVSISDGGTPPPTPTIEITQIDGIATETFLNTNTSPTRTLKTNQSYAFTVAYTNETVGRALSVRVISGSYGEVPAMTIGTGNTTSTDGTMVINWAPAAETAVGTPGHLQVYDATANLQKYNFNVSVSNAATTLGNEAFNKTKLAAYYNAATKSVVITDEIEGDYFIYDLSGKAVSTGKASSQINVSTLTSGLYILTTLNPQA
ncbi:hypothetical protein FFWV33_03795 [Flavobacterium faecale]|uniref:Secretion system C-terminal sorting domain-containing protein n=1 Tax=Flavobacterium faecale TaxID=1355330 RepID=A0A2S1LAG9_9FLAO|nr:T9SS type A sorting domain-containing protein [Flavobacterium faecale]AWG20724.1 hypothetical protein FFWV33_03795 [Flavobacterium faecale]